MLTPGLTYSFISKPPQGGEHNILPMIYNGCHRAAHGASSPHIARLSVKQMQQSHELCNLTGRNLSSQVRGRDCRYSLRSQPTLPLH